VAPSLWRVPTISRFYGIVIRMHWTEHGRPHFHARDSSGKAVVDIGSITVVHSSLSKRALALVLEWAALHQTELAENWRRCAQRLAPRSIPPLD
jgi:hypothetical protein